MGGRLPDGYVLHSIRVAPAARRLLILMARTAFRVFSRQGRIPMKSQPVILGGHGRGRCPRGPAHCGRRPAGRPGITAGLDASLVRREPMALAVETRGALTAGMAVADLRPRRAAATADACVEVEAERLLRLFTERVLR